MSNEEVNLKRIHNRMYELDSQRAKRNISHHQMAIEEFAKLIDDDEEIVFFSDGARQGKNRNGMVFVTNKRFILCLKLFLPYVEQFLYENITSIDYKKNFLNQGIIEINSFGDKVKFYYYEVEYLIDVVKYIKDMMIASKQQVNQSNASVADELLKLSELLKQGIISQEEFDKQKEKLLT